ncbi:MAG: hypothetical protein EOO29_53065, partial [Comamonadaceae bacterium]
WGLLAALVALGASQLRDRTASLARVSVMPIGMTAFSLWGTLSFRWASPRRARGSRCGRATGWRPVRRGQRAGPTPRRACRRGSAG